jgi:NADH dehydrogenase/NADH:ubiquinone oxidoreductase subunit G
MITTKKTKPEPDSKNETKEVATTIQADVELAPGVAPPALESPSPLEIDEKIEQHALNIQRIQRDAVFEIGRELAAAQDLFRYSRQEGGFKGWLDRRLPQFSERTAYRAIHVYKNVDPAMFAKLADIRNPSALAELAKAPPDFQALIAERVAAGEIFTAAKVKEIRAEAVADAAKKAAAEIERANEQIAELEAKLVEAGANVEELNAQIEELKAAINEHEDEIAEYQRSLPTPKEAEEQATRGGGVVLGSDMKFHSGATEHEKTLSNDYLAVWSLVSALANEKERPLADRVAAGCAQQYRKQLLGFISSTLDYLCTIREAVNAAPKHRT